MQNLWIISLCIFDDVFTNRNRGNIHSTLSGPYCDSGISLMVVNNKIAIEWSVFFHESGWSIKWKASRRITTDQTKKSNGSTVSKKKPNLHSCGLLVGMSYRICVLVWSIVLHLALPRRKSNNRAVFDISKGTIKQKLADNRPTLQD